MVEETGPASTTAPFTVLRCDSCTTRFVRPTLLRGAELRMFTAEVALHEKTCRARHMPSLVPPAAPPQGEYADGDSDDDLALMFDANDYLVGGRTGLRPSHNGLRPSRYTLRKEWRI